MPKREVKPKAHIDKESGPKVSDILDLSHRFCLCTQELNKLCYVGAADTGRRESDLLKKDFLISSH